MVSTGAAATADAKIICDGLTYTLTYTDGGAVVAKEDTLIAEELKTIKPYVELSEKLGIKF